MARNGGDAYPDPSKVFPGRCKAKILVFTIFLFICLGNSIIMVSTPGDQLPDPSCTPEPIFSGYFDSNPQIEKPVIACLAVITIG